MNVSADHLDRYIDMAEYAAAKRRIFRHSQLAIYNAEDPLTKPNSPQRS
ncbi:Mur ligase family protein [Alishewanella longhuensis]